ncbi:hypothetical protein Cme02nite_28850 [Catellatospora methionotrophica]|uniref:Glycosyltransferase n=1 Tax=Catellatospora methionotrophica TaxID=121620 RepID=A0A8J3PFN7_9ACTN|nr:glycosyltransferase family 4 protein [Catellatospora methionotrophica]GIG14553.1 hypothetical protein Cme02nite_28850 [Catellatospora methionotrophica]
MRLAIVADACLPTADDWSRNPRTLAEGLTGLGHEVTLLATASGTPTAADHTGRHARALLSPCGADTGQALTLLRPGCDTVLSLGTAAPTAAAVLAATLGIPLAVFLPPRLFDADPPPAGYGRLLCRHLPAAMLITESRRQLATARHHGADPHRVFVVPPGIDVGPPPAPGGRGDDGRLRLLVDATGTAAQEQRFLADVLATLAAGRHRIHTTVLGDGTTGHLWDGRPDTAVLTPSDTAALAGLYHDADVILVPGGGDRTVALLRAMAAGRALLAADSPAVQDTVGTTRNGMLARAGDPHEWVDKLDYLLDGHALRLHLGRGARLHAETHHSLAQTLRELDTRLVSLAASWRYPEPAGS